MRFLNCTARNRRAGVPSCLTLGEQRSRLRACVKSLFLGGLYRYELFPNIGRNLTVCKILSKSCYRFSVPLAEGEDVQAGVGSCLSLVERGPGDLGTAPWSRT
jgi:hypothetical protein